MIQYADVKLLNNICPTKNKNQKPMRKIFLLTITGMLALSLSSCKKDYSCACNVTATGYSETLTYTYKETSKKATEFCDDYKAGAISNAKNNGYTDASASCTLK